MIRHKLFFWLIVSGGIFSILLCLPHLQLDSDSSVTGLMARHILQQKNFPVFFYGCGYAGSLKAFLTAPVFRLFGSSNLILVIVQIILSTVFIISTYHLGREFYNREVGLLSMLFAAIPPASTIHWYCNPKGAYIETLLFGNIILILTHRICKCKTSSPINRATRQPLRSSHPSFMRLSCREGKNRDYVLLGLISGLAWWTNQLIMYYLLTSVFLIFISDKKIFLKKKFLLLVLFFFIGSAPAWLWNVTHGFISFAMDRISGWSHILPLYSVFPVIIGYGLNALRRRSRIIYLVCIFLILFTNIHGNKEIYTKAFPYALKKYPTEPLVEFLKLEGISRAYGSSYLIAPRVSFESNEEVICAEPFQEPVPGYLAEVDSTRNPAIICTLTDVDSVESAIRSVGGKYSGKIIRRFAVFYDFSPPDSIYEELDTGKWCANSNFNRASCPLAFDRDFGTRWTTEELQKPGMYYELDLGEEKEVSKLILLTSGFDSPRGFSIKVSIDGINYREVSNVSFCAGSVFWNGPHLFWKTFPQRIDIIFPQILSRFVRVTQINRSTTSWWSIEEIFVFSSKQVKPLPNYKIDGAAKFLKKRNIRYVYADEWLSARLDKELGNSVVTVHTHRVRDWYNELFPKSPLSRLIKFGSDSVLISDEAHCQSLSVSLSRLNIGYEVETIGSYRIYHNFEVDKTYAGSYYWTGFNVLKHGKPILTMHST